MGVPVDTRLLRAHETVSACAVNETGQREGSWRRYPRSTYLLAALQRKAAPTPLLRGPLPPGVEPGARDLDYLKKTPVPGRPLLAPCSAEEVVTGGRPPTRSGLLRAHRSEAFRCHLTPHQEVRRCSPCLTP